MIILPVVLILAQINLAPNHRKACVSQLSCVGKLTRGEFMNMTFTGMLLAGVLAVGPTCSLAEQGHGGDRDALQQQAICLVEQMVGRLKPALKKALQEGGPEHAIAVCSVNAPDIAASLSNSGWQVKRVSEKNRNPAAVPDEWETAVLEMFQTRLEEDSAPGALVFSEQTISGFRFAKAQITEGLCLNCHGTQLTPAVISRLNELYPNDRATGYSIREIRGMFSLLYKP